jgi:hypothetical protein
MYRTLGIINVILIVVITSPYWLRRLSQLLFPKKRIASTRMIKSLRAAHKPLGICLLLIALVHGYLALKPLRIHTGTLVGVVILITLVLGILFYRKRKAVFLKWHKRAALLMVLLTLLHIFVPSALNYLFG